MTTEQKKTTIEDISIEESAGFLSGVPTWKQAVIGGSMLFIGLSSAINPKSLPYVVSTGDIDNNDSIDLCIKSEINFNFLPNFKSEDVYLNIAGDPNFNITEDFNGDGLNDIEMKPKKHYAFKGIFLNNGNNTYTQFTELLSEVDKVENYLENR